MYTDPIADLLTRLRNGIRASKDVVTMPHSKIKENILNIMKTKGIIEDFRVTSEKNIKTIDVIVREGLREINFKRISKPGQRIYIKKTDLKAVKSGLGMSIISTSKGLMTNADARKANLGGEIICEIY